MSVFRFNSYSENEKKFNDLIKFTHSGLYVPGVKECDENLRIKWTEFCNSFNYDPDTLYYDAYIIRLYYHICNIFVAYQYAVEFDEFDDFMCGLLV